MHHDSYTPSLQEVLGEAIHGKSVSRTLWNLFWRTQSPLEGRILDIGGAGRGSHYRFLRFAHDASVETVDIVSAQGVDYVLDITKERVPLAAGSCDAVLLFNILEHLPVQEPALSEAFRLLKPGGRLIGVIPFLLNVHRDPEDYSRLTDTALSALFARCGFSTVRIEPIGRGPFLAAYDQLAMLIRGPAHLFLLPAVWLADALLQKLLPKRDLKAQFPLAYNFVAQKIV